MSTATMPTFCRHNRLIQNCPICTREQQIQGRPLITSSAPRSSLPREPTTGSGSPSGARSRGGASASRTGGGSGVRVRRLARGSDDGFHSRLVPGLRSSADAQRLAEEIAFAATRLVVLEHEPPGLYAEVADAAGDVEERIWLAFLIAYFGTLDGDDPFASVRALRTGWADGSAVDPGSIAVGPRGAHDPQRGGTRTLDAYRAWAGRSGSQQAALGGDAAWTPQRRFARAYERLALPGLHRDARFDLLVVLGHLGLFELAAGSLVLGGDNSVTVGAKRALGIGDPLLLDRRAADLATACGVPLEALDLGLYNWERGERTTGGLPAGSEADPDLTERCEIALGLA
jgi:hypothetical protein